MKINGGDCITLAPLCRKTTKRYFSSKRKMIYCELKSNYIRMVMASFDLKMVWTSTCALSKSLNCWQIWLQIDWKRSIYYINSLANSIINIKCHLLKREHSLITNTAIASLEFIHTLWYTCYTFIREKTFFRQSLVTFASYFSFASYSPWVNIMFPFPKFSPLVNYKIFNSYIIAPF